MRTIFNLLIPRVGHKVKADSLTAFYSGNKDTLKKKKPRNCSSLLSKVAGEREVSNAEDNLRARAASQNRKVIRRKGFSACANFQEVRPLPTLNLAELG